MSPLPPAEPGATSYGRAVVDGKLLYTSASAMNRHAECPRSYFFRYVEGIPDPVGPAADLGVTVHNSIEHYLTTGEDVLHKVARAGLGFIPEPGNPPGHGLFVEQRVDGVLDIVGVPVKGGIDLLNLRGPVPNVVDWKTKGSPDKYKAEQMAKGYARPGDWLVDPEHSDGRQMIAYAEWTRRSFELARDRFAGLAKPTEVVLSHVYLPTGRGYADEIEVRVGLDKIKKLWHQIGQQFVEPIKATAKASNPEDVAANRGHCRKWNRLCPYYAHCPKTGVEIAAPIALFKHPRQPPSENPMSLLNRLKSMSAETPAPTSTPAPAQVSQAMSGDVVRHDAPSTPAMPTGAALDYVSAVGKGDAKAAAAAVEKMAEAEEEFAAVLPPDAPASAPVIAAPTASDAPVETAPAPKKRGRPPKSAATASEQFAVIADGKVEVTRASTAEPTRLYFGGSYPVGVETKTLHAYVQTLDAAIVAAFKLPFPDVRLADVDGLKFGKWKAVLASVVRENPLEPGSYLVNRGDERIEVVADALAALLPAGSVVRAGGL